MLLSSLTKSGEAGAAAAAALAVRRARAVVPNAWRFLILLLPFFVFLGLIKNTYISNKDRFVAGVCLTATKNYDRVNYGK
jgi:hypothetical protein